MKSLKNKEEVMNELLFNGQSVSGWAREHGFHPSMVRRVINGEVSGRIGASHKIAVMLGMKGGVVREEGSHEHA